METAASFVAIIGGVLTIIGSLAWSHRHLSKGFNDRFDSVDKRFESVDTRLDSIDRRFDAIDRRFDVVDRRFDVVDNRLEAVDGRLSNQISTLDVRVYALATAFARHFDPQAEPPNGAPPNGAPPNGAPRNGAPKNDGRHPGPAPEALSA